MTGHRPIQTIWVVIGRMNRGPRRSWSKVIPVTALLDVLRRDLGSAGPKFGCGIGRSDTCSVLVGGRVRASCALPVSAVA
jgi:aerobic-type carbon monoxide dehydrogenase small subunit (CoxS/CutS family)